MEGEVFGSFTSSPWRKQSGYFGIGDAFLWRLKKPRLMQRHLLGTFSDNILEVYPYTNNDSYLQLFNKKGILCIGGGEWKEDECPYQHDSCGIGLLVDIDKLYGESWSSSTFANPVLCKESVDNKFEISNLEVWTFTPCASVEDAERLEMKKLFLERINQT
jgi:hypothetical protein